MSPRNRTENSLLRALVNEARWTNHNLALAVNRVAAESGITLRYDRTTVSHWLWGTRPRPHVAAFIAEALSRRLDRFVSTADIGMTDAAPDATTSTCDEPSGTTALHALVTADLDPVRRSRLYQQPFRLDWAVTGPWHPTGSERPSHHHGVPQSPTGHTAALVAMTAAFASTDQAFGGDIGRSALKAYLATDVLTWLRSSSGGQERRELLAAASALTRLMGFKCFDSLHCNLAQRYYRVSLRLAEEAGDTLGHGETLFYMGIQASFLGHHSRAAQLVSAALYRTKGVAPPETHAAFLGQAAVAYAALACSREATTFLSHAERQVEKIDTVSRPGQTPQADLAYRVGQAMLLSKNYRESERWLLRSLGHRPGRERRSRMLTAHLLADSQLAQGQVENACAAWRGFLEDYPYMHSGRVDRAIMVLRRRLQRYRGNPAVERVLSQAMPRAG
ncbi:tetratricopeptide repeat protein [Saccharothrix australiensis]|uniref:Transcriptional regulator n=1 Tax=Saccharothrix australiensis TaxID=2072 RepID=A0A495VZ03_9PSEU|nr:hypothetical protein [Saccharothrix australiensis]RKT54444.1 hypothetical protein C8E97_3066 [Saccharothrix australiensis]